MSEDGQAGHGPGGRAGYTVGDVAGLAGVSVRTLHHYDRIGLLSPRHRSAAGYRLYSAADLDRLRQILGYRELGFGLAEVAAILATPGQDADAHLRRQHRLLRQQVRRSQALLAAIENELEARKMGIGLTPEEQLEVFGTGKVGEWAAEAEQHWGDTEAWRQSQRRAAAYTKEDWLEVRREEEAVRQEFLAAMTAGEPADGPRAVAAAQRHRRHISERFYDCSPQLHAGLAELYVSDERFRRSYDDLAPGLARYVHDAIVAAAGREA